MSLLPCALCGENVEVDADFSAIGVKFDCPRCHGQIHLAYESIYDDETQDAFGWFYLEAVNGVPQ